MMKQTVKIPVIVAGKLGDPELAERVLQEGRADFIALGRPLLADPDWPNKVREGRFEDIRPCIGDHEGCLVRMYQRQNVSCTVNPATGMDREFELKPADKRKNVLVIGGGPGGMEAARVSALRGHKVTLLEKGGALGGSLIPATVPEFKKEYRRLIDYLSTQMRKLGVTVMLHKEADPELVRSLKPDVIFVATGGRPLVPDIPGVNKACVVTAVDVLLGRKQAGDKVVVIGGGSIGCETALHLAQKGKKLTVIESQDSVMRDIPWMNRMHLRQLLAGANVEVLTDTVVVDIMDGGVTIATGGDRTFLPADTVVLAAGFTPDDRLPGALRDAAPEVYTIGDCLAPRKVINAIWEGFRTARLI
jgi:2-enoate reductase